MKNLMKKLAAVVLGASLLFTSVSGASAATYTVKSGDTLTAIAKKHGTSYIEIMNTNALKSTNISIGQKLEISTASTTKTTSTTSNSNIVKNANKYLGARYQFGGSSPSGFDCSGFVYYVFKQSGKFVSRTSAAGFYNQSTKVSSPKIGDLVFFSNTYKRGISHVGIYVGNGKMISASGSNVNITSIHTGYWKSFFTGYGRI